MILTPEIATLLSSRSGADHQWMIHVGAKNRTTGLVEYLSLWTGAYDATITADGVSRTYVGAGGMVGVSGLEFNEGLVIRVMRVSLAIMDSTVAAMIRGYEPRGGSISIYLAVFQPGTEDLVGATRVFTGRIDRAPISRGAKSESGAMTEVCDLEAVSSARQGTRALSGKKSDASQRLRDSADGGRRYANISVTPTWGGDRKAGNFWSGSTT